MDSTVLAALIGLGGAVAGAVIITYGRDIGHAMFGSKEGDSDLVSEWNCNWYIDTEDSGEVLGISDVVKITSVRSKRIRGVGTNPETGEYVLEGTVSQHNVITVTFQCTAMHNLTGVAILQVNVLRKEMNGQWLQFGANETFFGGRTVWSKREN